MRLRKPRREHVALAFLVWPILCAVAAKFVLVGLPASIALGLALAPVAFVLAVAAIVFVWHRITRPSPAAPYRPVPRG